MKNIIELLRNEVRPALGCTEPAAVALACAYAAHGLEGPIESINVLVDPNVYKNGMGVFVPGADMVGLEVAAALGAVVANPTLELEVLRGVTPSIRDDAFALLNQGRVKVEPAGDFGSLKIVATIKNSSCESTAEISGSHTHLSALFRNGEQTFTAPVQEASGGCVSWIKGHSLKELIIAVRGKGSELGFLLPLARQNKQVAMAGIANPLGVGLGYNLQRLIKKGQLGNDLPNYVMSYVAAAADTRMSGYPVTVISTNGSGNQGISASLPVLLVYDYQAQEQQDKLCEALALSHLVTVYVKQHIGKLSASCACAMAAAIGASCGIAYLLDQQEEQIENCVNLMAANLTGMICDGAKVSCSFKLATAALTAVQTALLAGIGVAAPATDGILAYTPEETICNLGEVSNPGMRETDRVILNLMCGKKRIS